MFFAASLSSYSATTLDCAWSIPNLAAVGRITRLDTAVANDNSPSARLPKMDGGGTYGNVFGGRPPM